MPRLFVAVELPHPLREAVAGLQSPLQGARWLKAYSLHLTFAFIGEVDDAAQGSIEVALNAVTAPPLPLNLQGLGCFPRRGAPRVLWTGASPETELVSLADAVREALRRAGLAPERRPFAPHVTIARFRRPPPGQELKQFLDAFSTFQTSPVDVASFHLFSSELRPSGAQYRQEATFPLTGAPPDGFEAG